jgi:hypothetical protein
MDAPTVESRAALKGDRWVAVMVGVLAAKMADARAACLAVEMAASKAAHSAASMDASSVESTVGETDETSAVVLVVWWGGK